MKMPFYKRRRGSSVESITALLDKMSAQAERPGEARLARLWQNWAMVMGPELAELAWPLGHRGGILLIGGEDPMAIQDLSFLSAEILERANAFMDFPFFREVKVGPCLGKTPLDAASAETSLRERGGRLKLGPFAEGVYLSAMNPDSPVARCYALFVKKK